MTARYRVTLLPGAVETWVPSGTSLLEAAAEANVAMDAPCGNRGICGKCRVRVLTNASPATPQETALIAPDDLKNGWRLACQSRVIGHMVIQVPERAI